MTAIDSCDRRRGAALVGAVLLVLLLGACGSDTGDEADAGGPTPDDVAAETDASDAGTTSTTLPDDDAPSTTTTAPEPVVVADPPAGFAQIDPTAEVTDSPSRPRLSWTPAEGAARYAVTVYDAEGRAYWTTLTADTTTFVGGPSLLIEDRPGPRAPEGGSWQVLGLDDEGRAVAWSPRVTFAV